MLKKKFFYFDKNSFCEKLDVQIKFFDVQVLTLELVSKELNHLAAILHVYAGGLNFMK
jgi:hypothetical protein